MISTVLTHRLAKQVSLLLAGAAVLVGAAAPSHAALTQKNSRALLGGNDFIDWAAAGAVNSTHVNPFIIISNDALQTTVSKPSSGPFERRNQGSGWNGNFAPGDALIWTRFTSGPLMLEFANPVWGGGTQIQRNAFGAFTGTVEAFDSLNMSLGSFSLNGNSNNAGNNSAIFLGVLSDSANIKKLAFNVDGEQDFALNQVDLVTQREVSPAPEPASMALLSMGALPLLRRLRRRRSDDVTETI
jgi:hypothetical protein